MESPAIEIDPKDTFMIAYLLAPVCAFVSAILFVIPSEVMVLALANMDKMTFEVFGRTVDLTKYGTDFPWLLPFAASAGGVAGSYFYYLMGSGAMKISGKIKQKIDSFDMSKMSNVGAVALLTANIASIPPVSITTVAAGIIKLEPYKFFAASFVGRTIRYYIVILVGKFAVDLALKWFGG